MGLLTLSVTSSPRPHLSVDLLIFPALSGPLWRRNEGALSNRLVDAFPGSSLVCLRSECEVRGAGLYFCLRPKAPFLRKSNPAAEVDLDGAGL